MCYLHGRGEDEEDGEEERPRERVNTAAMQGMDHLARMCSCLETSDRESEGVWIRERARLMQNQRVLIIR